ncbi:MAG TPA: hypothetical protein VGF28_02640 [Thermoanaerobaculia bacterium]|jgi:hypothetical protein
MEIESDSFVPVFAVRACNGTQRALAARSFPHRSGRGSAADFPNGFDFCPWNIRAET